MKNFTKKRTVLYLRILYPVWMLLAIISLIVIPSTFLVEGDAVQTANNIASNEYLFRAGILGSIITQILHILIPLLLFQILKAVNKNQATLMVVLAIVSVPITMYNELYKLSALTLLNSPIQMMQVFDLNNQNQIVSFIFWGLWLFPLGYLVNKSSFFPKAIAIILIVAGVGYILGAFCKILLPNATAINTIFEILTFGEVIFISWFMVKGINIEKLKNTAPQLYA